MHEYITKYMKIYPNVCGSPVAVLEHLFAVLGNGIDLDHKGYIPPNHKCQVAYEFPAPEALVSIYPWSDNEEYQPFRKYAGCRDVGFKEAAQYFIECIKLTPDTCRFIKDWKDNIHIVEDVLLNTPMIEEPYTIDDMDKFVDDIKGDERTGDRLKPPSTKNSVSKAWLFDVQWSDCPKSVENEVREAWADHELGNDWYIMKVDVDEELFDSYPRIYFWLKHKGVPDNETVIINWWW